MQTITTIYALLFGLCFGSFANVIIYRLPRRESVVKPSSYCPCCNKNLAPLDLIPILSWLVLRGRCRYCHNRISWRYPVVEAVCSLLFGIMSLHTGAMPAVIPLCILSFVLLCVSIIDIDTQEIPDELLIFAAITGVVWVITSNFFSYSAPTPLNALLGVLAGGLPLFFIDRLTILLIGKNGFGFGDVKLMAVTGLFLGPQAIFLSLFCAVVIGGMFGAFLLITHRAEKGAYFAFGPFLALAIFIAIWFEQPLISLLFPML